MPPAVLTITASRSAATGPGKRTRSEPASPTCRRRVTPRAAATDSATWPRARLAAKVCAALAKTDTAIASSENLERQHARSEEHTSELQSRGHLVCRLL